MVIKELVNCSAGHLVLFLFNNTAVSSNIKQHQTKTLKASCEPSRRILLRKKQTWIVFFQKKNQHFLTFDTSKQYTAILTVLQCADGRHQCVGTMTAELQSKAHVYSLEYFVSNVCFSFLCVLVFLLSGLLRVVKKRIIKLICWLWRVNSSLM